MTIMKKGILWLAFCVPGLMLVSCNDPNEDYERALAQEKQLVAYLEENYPDYEQVTYEGVGTTQYCVPVVEGTGDYPELESDYISISYRTWKMDNYTTWEPNDADLLNTSDSAESDQKLVIRNYMHGGPEIYPLTATFPEFGLALSKMKKGGKIMLYIAPSVSSGILDYTRVMEITLTDIIHADDFDSIQHHMMAQYRASTGVPEDELGSKHLITTSSSSIAITTDDSYIIVDPNGGEGDVPYWVEHAGTGDVITDGSTINVTALKYGYLQRGRNVADLDKVDYISLGSGLTFPDYKVGEGYTMFGDALDELLIGQRKGVTLHVFALSKFAYGWPGSMNVPTDDTDPDAYSTFVVPPAMPVVFEVTVGF